MSDPDVSTVLTSIQVDIAAIRGDLSTLRAEMSGQAAIGAEQLDRQRRDLDALGSKIRRIEERVSKLESQQAWSAGRLAGVSASSAAVVSVLTTLVARGVAP